MFTKKSRTNIAVFLCLCLAVCCLTACGQAAGATVEETQQTAEESRQTAEETAGESRQAAEEAAGESRQAAGEENLDETAARAQSESAAVQEESHGESGPVQAGPEQAGPGRTESDIPSPSSCGKLSVDGTQLVDENGEAVQLRGLSTHGLSFYPQYVNEELFAELRWEWKANVIRLAMYTAEYNGYCAGGDREDLKDLIRRGVEYAANQDLYVIVDWHILSDGNPNQHKAEAIDFFAQMSEEFAGYDNVLYEICNEPNGGTSWGDIKSYAEEVIPVIRANAPDAVILVGTPNWSQYVGEAAADPITGYDNIMYTLHFYAATHKDDLRNAMTAAIEAGLPVFVSEYGICDASGNGGIDEAQADAWVQVMDQYGVSYVAWNISNKNETSAIFKSSVEKTSGFAEEDLSDSGRWLYHTLTGGDLPCDGNQAPTAPNGGQDGTAPDSGQDETASNGGQDGTAPDSGQDETASNGGQDGTTPSSSQAQALQSGDLEVSAAVVNSWESDGQHFYQYTLTIKNTLDRSCDSWEVDVMFDSDISLSDGWNGQYTVQGDTLHISSMDYNGQIPAGGSVQDVGFIVSGAEGLTVR